MLSNIITSSFLSINMKKPASTKIGRPTEFSRESAIEAAMNLFWQKGYQGVSAKDLADSMSIQRSSFYNSFGSKEALFTEALALYGSLSPDIVLTQIKPGEPVMPVIEQLLKKLCHIRANDPDARGCLVCNSIAELEELGEHNETLITRALENKIALIQRLLNQAAEQQEIDLGEHAEQAGKSFIAFLLGLNLLSKIIKDEKQLWSICEQFLSGFKIK